MARIIYIQHDDTDHVVEVKTGLSVMEGAVKNRDARTRARLSA